MKRLLRGGAAVLAGILIVGSVAPAFGGPDALSAANLGKRIKRALGTAKKANKTAKAASRKATTASDAAAAANTKADEALALGQRSADLGATITSTPDPPSGAQDVAYTYVVSNAGPAAVIVTLDVGLPRNYNSPYPTLQPSAGSCSLPGYLGRARCYLGLLQPGASASVSTSFNPCGANSDLFIATADVYSHDATDPNPANDLPAKFGRLSGSSGACAP